METKQIHVKVDTQAHDKIELKLELRGDEIVKAEITSIACPELLGELKKFKQQLKNLKAQWSNVHGPEGSGHAQMILRELVLKARGEWKFPYDEMELCHCRNVPASVVDSAILCGSHRVQEVAEKTMAGTGCGTCRPTTQKVIEYRLKAS